MIGKLVLRTTATLALTLIGAMGTLATAQSNSSSSPATTGPVAFVYVSSSTTTTNNVVDGYAAAANGSLTKISGSPFVANVGYLALNGSWLFGNKGQYDIASFKIGATGGLTAGPVVNTNSYGSSGSPVSLTLDHTGQSLYPGIYLIDGANNGYQAYKIIQSTGQLDFQENVPPYNVDTSGPITFLANNQYAYGSNCVKGGPVIFGYKRSSTGQLTDLGLSPYIPPTNIAGSGYCPYLAAADPFGHVAITLTPFQPYTAVGPPQVAIYTAAANGTLTTTSTSANMPKLKVGNVQAMKMAPSGKLLAVGGSSGLQVVHFNGAAPAKSYTGLLATAEIDQIMWDNANHLYAISRQAGKLFVFTVTPTNVTQAPGSPHAIAVPNHIAVLPK